MGLMPRVSSDAILPSTSSGSATVVPIFPASQPTNVGISVKVPASARRLSDASDSSSTVGARRPSDASDSSGTQEALRGLVGSDINGTLRCSQLTKAGTITQVLPITISVREVLGKTGTVLQSKNGSSDGDVILDSETGNRYKPPSSLPNITPLDGDMSSNDSSLNQVSPSDDQHDVDITSDHIDKPSDHSHEHHPDSENPNTTSGK